MAERRAAAAPGAGAAPGAAVGAVPAARAAAAGCLSCGEPGLDEVIDLGETPLANSLLDAARLTEPEPRFPLRVAACPRCTLVQLRDSVPPERLFSDYVYFSSFSDEAVRHAREHVEELLARRRLGPDSLVVEIASNDGYLLQWLVEAGVPVLGIEPAANVAAAARAKGVETLVEFFGEGCARRLRAEGRRADVVLANNVLAHVPDLNGFVAGAASLLAPGGIVELEFPYLGDFLERVEFDTVYHEHLCYFGAQAIEALFARHGLAFVDVRRLPIHGGSLRVTGALREAGAGGAAGGTGAGGTGACGARGGAAAAVDPEGRARVEALLDEERASGLHLPAAHARFREAVAALRGELLGTLGALKAEGRRLVAYGASAKGATLLNVFGIGGELLDYVVDRSTVKQGRFTPGSHLPILPVERLLEDQPDVALLLTWNFADEILAQQAEWRRRGGRFLVPVPRPRLV